MAEFNNAHLVGAHSVAPTPEQLTDIARYDKAAGSANRAGLARQPASTMCIPLDVATLVPSGGSAVSAVLDLPFPVKVFAIDGSGEVFGAGLSALTLEVEVDRGAGFVSILDAPEDLFGAGEGLPTRVAPEDGEEDLAYFDKLRVTFAATGGTVAGAGVKLWAQRL